MVGPEGEERDVTPQHAEGRCQFCSARGAEIAIVEMVGARGWAAAWRQRVHPNGSTRGKYLRERFRMARPILAQVLRAAALACFIQVGAQAEPFKCPHVGGEFTFGQETNVNSLDQMTSTTISTRNVAMNIFETLMTRDENNSPINDLAASMTEAPDHMSYTFKLRQGVKFHNGKPMSSADVVASFERYSKVGNLRSMLANVAGWDAPDAETFVIRMKKPQPTFILQLSSFSLPIVIIPAENKDDPPQQLKTIGTGPWQLADYTPGSAVKLRRYDGYTPNANFEVRAGFGGYKQACFDTVTFRIVTEPGARVAGLKTGELQGVEDLPTKALAALKTDKNITLLPLQNWVIQVAVPNISVPPTDNLYFRQAVQAALDMDEIMDAATDGNYRLNVGLQYPTQDDYTDAGKETYNIKDSARAKQYLQQSGYKGEPVILLTTREISAMYNSSLVMAEQLKAVDINAQLKVVDWPTSVNMALKADTGWNFFYSSWGTVVAMGGLGVIQILINPNAVYHPKDGKDDPDLLAAWSDMNDLTDPAARQEAFARAQKIALERVYAVPFGSVTKVQAVRSNVQGFEPFRIPRMSNVWFAQ
jgi:peptide/nickel transport system substrate-binding protein